LLGIANQEYFIKDENDYPLWYKDGELNICYLALDQHIQDGHGQIAFIYDSPVTQTVKSIAMQRLNQSS
jgi:acyl-coenzyme A synthetase/AMP-(fatty) acid ligase